MRGLEPPRLAAPEPKSGASTSSATSARVRSYRHRDGCASPALVLIGFAAVLAAAQAPAAPLPSPPMTVQVFLDKAAALKAKGPLAMVSPDLKLLIGEIQEASRLWKLQAPACTPKTQKMTSDQVLAMLDEAPADQRPQLEVKAAFVQRLNERYRC